MIRQNELAGDVAEYDPVTDVVLLRTMFIKNMGQYLSDVNFFKEEAFKFGHLLEYFDREKSKIEGCLELRFGIDRGPIYLLKKSKDNPNILPVIIGLLLNIEKIYFVKTTEHLMGGVRDLDSRIHPTEAVWSFESDNCLMIVPNYTVMSFDYKFPLGAVI